jgi:thiol-disulfide isomerase/thioredoxin/NAD-dependent dihydropyrimidine dehydrogenase PreA subunit
VSDLAEINTTTKKKGFLPSKRRLIQLFAALLYNAHLKGFITGEIYTGKVKAVCVPGFNCYSCPGAAGACPLGSLQNALSASGHRAGFYVFGILMLYGLILGRTICGWLCPLGLIQELLHKIPTFKIKKSRITRAFSYLKYVILGVLAVAIPLWYGLSHGMAVPGFCKYICPAGTFEGAVGMLSNPNNNDLFGILNILFTRKFIIMLIIGLGCIFLYRFFCRFICPLGAIYGFFNKLAIVGVKVDVNRCNHCGACVRNCQMDVKHIGDHECINCGKCMDVCAQKAISIKAGKITLVAPDGGCADDKPDSAKKRRIIGRTMWSAAGVLLAFSLVWFNFLDPAVQKEGIKASADSTPPAVTETTEQTEVVITEGYEVGQRLKDFEIATIDGSTFKLSENRGKVVVINLWATYCGPCVQELPHFNEFAAKHADDTALLAVHSSFVDQEVGEYLADKGWDNLPFAVDTEDDMVWGIVNGTSALPQTIVLDANGIVIYNQRGSITPELLESLYEQAKSSSETSAAAETAAQVQEGYEVGQKLKDFEITCVDGSTFKLSDTKGKIVLINLWATYCGPCVQELPHFNEFAEKHADDTALLAVHSSFVDQEVGEYLSDKGWNNLPFAVDTEDDMIWGIVNGTSALPQTIVLDRNGVVIYNQRGSVTPELLESLYEKAKG